ncbi:hypothetical protein K0O13_07895 [Mammaliicoccus sciuri]|uniref:hypothetical protein n=1 Tax=Mammaliicoccus sciuri TaxID=1296 RepID=UPI001C63900E|nr:hypothetical protein [Mammaliicoccus sciuri]QYG30021.1 hypothetical protein K0O13_07895 [Mammaliicoccus sciuri]
MNTPIIEINARFKGTENLTSEQLHLLLNQLELSDIITLIRSNNVADDPIILKSDTFDITIK